MGSPTEATALADLRTLMLRVVNLFLSRKGLIESAANAHDLAEDCAQEAVLLIRNKLPGGEEWQDLLASWLLAKNDRAVLVGAMRLEDMLRQMQTNCANNFHGRFL